MCPGYDTKLSDCEAPILAFSEIWNSSSLSLLSVPLGLGVVASDRVLSMGQIELFDI